MAPPICPLPPLEFFASTQAKSEEAMLKTSIAAACLALLAVSTAYADQHLCTDAHMTQMDSMIAKMTDADKQKAANAALDQSKAAMKAGNKDECMKHMMDAHKAMGL
jgi:hypothetical protein